MVDNLKPFSVPEGAADAKRRRRCALEHGKMAGATTGNPDSKTSWNGDLRSDPWEKRVRSFTSLDAACCRPQTGFCPPVITFLLSRHLSAAPLVRLEQTLFEHTGRLDTKIPIESGSLGLKIARGEWMKGSGLMIPPGKIN